MVRPKFYNVPQSCFWYSYYRINSFQMRCDLKDVSVAPPPPPTTFKHGFWKAVKFTNAPEFTSFCHINLLGNLTIYFYPLKSEVRAVYDYGHRVKTALV